MPHIRLTTTSLAAIALVASPAIAQQDIPSAQPQNGTVYVGEGQLPQPAPTAPAQTAPAPTSTPGGTVFQSSPTVQTVPTDYFATAPAWTQGQAEALLGYIANLGNEGLFPADYTPAELEAAISAGDGEQLNEVATRIFTMVALDLRDGRTEMDSRRQWFVRDPDAERLPIKPLLEEALTTGDIIAALDSLNPVHPDYAVLKQMLMETPESETEKRDKIRINMDRWRWLARDLGRSYLLTNVPEYQLRLTVNDKIVRSYRTIVGKPGRTSTPQLAETVEGVIFNPTWTVPQSIVVGEGLGAKVLNNPSYAKAKNYKAWKNESGMTVVVQQPGPTNSLGMMKLDMPNPHAIFLHDTPAKNLFDTDNRAYSHGCIRTDRALELALTLAMVLGEVPKEEAVEISKSGKYTKVPLKKEIPVYITYFTMAQDIDGEMRSFADIYGRDEPVLASFKAPRVAKDGRRVTDEEVVAIENPGL
nr:L,D-transpeptidase family protein [Croceicoccus gelatinilyticus]